MYDIIFSLVIFYMVCICQKAPPQKNKKQNKQASKQTNNNNNNNNNSKQTMLTNLCKSLEYSVWFGILNSLNPPTPPKNTK